jgi:hypothetical protein
MKAGICCWTVNTNRTFLHIPLTFVVYGKDCANGAAGGGKGGIEN